ncbi:MAG: 2-amino-4-hydroxy-6-hydroxymethyldihydropteridine diphosphokinase [Elusimicrobia bacterium]|nr:2-amino-4-hydroxy-6-hydroxymethyldihydropteridine diphosphokinase [Elusimicrobiota bacterium]
MRRGAIGRRNKPVVCRLLLGGNEGDRLRNLDQAVRSLLILPGTRVLARSRVYETAPIGPADRPFLNQALEIETSLSPMGLLVECKRIEAEAGRRPGLRWGNRPLDIDILSYGRLRLRTPWLTIPHPRIAQRAFVLAPLRELAPRWAPDGRRSVAALLRRLNRAPGTVKIFK